jgi:hypothetical protein
MRAQPSLLNLVFGLFLFLIHVQDAGSLSTPAPNVPSKNTIRNAKLNSKLRESSRRESGKKNVQKFQPKAQLEDEDIIPSKCK